MQSSADVYCALLCADLSQPLFSSEPTPAESNDSYQVYMNQERMLK